MCGMAGIYAPGEELVDHAPWVAEALEAIAHRGPDGRGMTATTGGTIHGHVRLAIQDPLPRSDQPFVYGDMVLSFVGEVWNFRLIRAALEGLDHRFETDGDTEVVAAALEEWGVRALTMLEGMFSLAWTDGLGRTFLARDRFGKVPLYLLEEEDNLFSTGRRVRWASERKAFGRDSLDAWRLPPGTYYELGSREVTEWYRLGEAVAEAHPLTAAGVARELQRAVQERLQADVPVCCLLSGGLDSAYVLALTQRVKPDVVAYAAVWDPHSEDIITARRLCADLGVPLREVRVPRVGYDEVRESIRAIEVVSKTQVEIGTLCLPLAERIYADGFRVCLSGEGADELFGGYGTLARRATSDERWREERMEFLRKMSRSDFMRVNKSFMAHGVECRTPFLDRRLVEGVLACGVKECRPGKRLLKEAAHGVLPEYVIRRKKVTFQGGAGLSGHLEWLFDGKQRKVYNELSREVFGGLIRG